MAYDMILKAAKELGLGLGVFALCAWITIKIVKDLCSTMEELRLSFIEFTTRVKEEHRASQEQHRGLMSQHDEMMKILGRINGYK